MSDMRAISAFSLPARKAIDWRDQSTGKVSWIAGRHAPLDTDDEKIAEATDSASEECASSVASALARGRPRIA